MEYHNTLIVELADQFYDQFDLSVSDANYLATNLMEKLCEIRMNNELDKLREKFLAVDKSLKAQIVRAVKDDNFDFAKELAEKLEPVEAVYLTNCSVVKDKYDRIAQQLKEK